MKSTVDRGRKLHSGHFAFMRAIVQGVDPTKAWEQYLQLESENTDARKVKSAIAWMRAEFAAAARRESKPGTARLVLIDAAAIGETKPQPTLEEFALDRGLEDFSQEEQVEAYAAEFGTATRRTSRRGQLVNRQLAALRWLEDLVAQSPKPGDGVAAWLAPALASRIEAAGCPTLFALIERINTAGARWWRGVPGIGAGKAARIVDWLTLHEASIGMSIGRHALLPSSQLQPSELEAVVPQATALVPLDKFLVPAELDGSAGAFRGERSTLAATNDYEAISAWLDSKRGGDGPQGAATKRAYRKEAERLLLWSILERGKAISSLTLEDANAFRDFLAAPPLRWCGPRYRGRWSPQWRPLEGPLSRTAMRQALVILRSMFAFLMSQNYVVGNPFSGVTLPRASSRQLGSNRALTFEQWDFISAQLVSAGEQTELQRRRARAIRWLYATGLRLAEISSAECGALERLRYTNGEGKKVTGWLLAVVGKGEKERKVPVPAALVDELGEELARTGRDRDPLATENAHVPILAKFDKPGDTEPQAWSSSGLYKSIRAFMKACALKLNDSDAQQVLKASTHWLRHSHASHALNGREGHDPVPLEVVRNNMGHSSIATTSGYLTGERDARLRAMEGFWGKQPG